MLIAQISDLHLRADGKPLNGVVDSGAALAACIDHLARLNPRPDLVLATGDLAHDGQAADYAALRRAFDRLEMPVYVIPGNHDVRRRLRAAFADAGYLPSRGPFLHYVVEDHPLRLIGLDTILLGQVGGEMCSRRLAWLEDRLAEQPERPTLIFMHHPPFPTGIAFMDSPPFEGADALERLIRRHPEVRHVVCGHVHRAIARAWAGTVASVAPSPVFQMALVFQPGAPSAFVLEPPALSLYHWEERTGVVGFTSPIGDFGAPRPFHPPPESSPESNREHASG